MLSKDISYIINFVESKGINPAEPSTRLMNRLAEAQADFKTNFLVYNYESDRLFFANDQALAFLGIKKHGTRYRDSLFLENILHPINYQLLKFNQHLRHKKVESFDGIFYIKTNDKRKYVWVYASAKVLNFNLQGVRHLIYICFVEVEKALEHYLKFLSRASTAKDEGRLIELSNLLKPREIAILSLIADECPSKEIAHKLNISQTAVDAARKRLIKKLKVKSVVGLVKIAVSLGLTGKTAFGYLGRNLVRQQKNVPTKINRRTS